jgi:urea carboxylase
LPPVVEKEPEQDAAAPEIVLAKGQKAIRSQVAGSVWQLTVEPGARVKVGDKLAVLETMKMETVVTAPEDGIIASTHCRQGMLIQPGTLLIVLSPLP